MSGPPKPGGSPVTDKRELVEYIAAGATPREEWRIGTEHEKFGFRLSDLAPLPYEGPQGIRALLEGLQRFSWQPFYENGKIIGLKFDGQAVTLRHTGRGGAGTTDMTAKAPSRMPIRA